MDNRQRRYFLTDIPLEQARERFFGALERAGALSPLPAEMTPLAQARGRITAQPLWAAISSPHYDAAAMDGVAVRSADTVGATETAPVSLTTTGTTGGITGDALPRALWVDTGDPLPPEFDAVIMVEHLHRVDDHTIRIMAPVAPWQHVRLLGEDIVATELVLPENHRLTPVDLGACAAAGLTEAPVRRRPRVAIIPTGNELVPVGSELKPGDIVEFNSLMLSALVEEWGGSATVVAPVPDDYPAIRDAARAALAENDAVIINAGSSAGAADYTAAVVEELGQLLVHGIAIRPGHPVVLGLADRGPGSSSPGDGDPEASNPDAGNPGGGSPGDSRPAVKPVIGLPGYPVSAVLTAELLVKPLLERKLGLGPQNRRPRLNARITRKVLSPLGEDEFLRVKLGRVGEKLVATPVQRGAGVIMSLVRADGLALIPRFAEGVEAGAEVAVELLRPPDAVENTIVATGSHDLTLDLMSSFLRRRHPGLTLSASHIGSLGGLVALRRGEAHLAGSHLLDEDTGDYNVAYLRRYLPGLPVLLINLVGRVQGLVVNPGNPKGIHTLADLLRPDVSFVNRQRGSGTRVLLDYKLKEMDAGSAGIRGYDREEYSHLAVAAAVKGGSADAGLGILSAARALGLDFVPLLNEEYDLVIPRVHYESDRLQPLLALLQDAEFRQEVANLGGYDTANMGRVKAELE